MDIKNIEINEKFDLALDLMNNTNGNIFITGKAGTGKSTLLEYFRRKTAKETIVLAPTGVAAVNVSGQTIHSFFKFRPNLTIEKAQKIAGSMKKRNMAGLYEKIDTIIIDEISMVRADLLDAVDQFLRVIRGKRALPFGGVQMIFVGDLFQLSPIVSRSESEIFAEYYTSPYFFDSLVFREIRITYIELEKIYRQKDQDFIDILNGIRDNSISNDQLEALNTRTSNEYDQTEGLSVYLTTINRRASDINLSKLSQIPSKAQVFTGKIEGDFKKESLPTELDLTLKEGSQIMLLNNDKDGRWVNGTVGVIKELADDSFSEVIVELANGSEESITPFTWELYKYELNRKTGSIETKVAGKFTQLPLKLAWAITIHKSQGKTFDQAIIDFGYGAFAPGQAYVALSRCRNISGIYLKKRLRESDIMVDRRVLDFQAHMKNYS